MFFREQASPGHLIYFICHFAASDGSRNRGFRLPSALIPKAECSSGVKFDVNNKQVLGSSKEFVLLFAFSSEILAMFVHTNCRFSLLGSAFAVIFVRILSIANLLCRQLVSVYYGPTFLSEYWAHK